MPFHNFTRKFEISAKNDGKTFLRKNDRVYVYPVGQKFDKIGLYHTTAKKISVLHFTQKFKKTAKHGEGMNFS